MTQCQSPDMMVELAFLLYVVLIFKASDGAMFGCSSRCSPDYGHAQKWCCQASGNDPTSGRWEKASDACRRQCAPGLRQLILLLSGQLPLSKGAVVLTSQSVLLENTLVRAE
jgi:hypothetical protein